MSYAIPYLIFLLLLAVLALSYDRLDEKLRERMWMPCSFLLILFLGLRGYIGDDWTGYHVMFEYVKPNDFHFNVFASHSFRFEPGIAILAYVCRRIAGGDGYLFFQFIVTLIQVILLMRFLKRYSSNFPLGVIIFLMMSGLIMMINLMRNTIAILIFLNGLHYIEERRPLPYFLVCFAALMFHLSAFIYFPLYFFLHRPINRWVYLTLFIIGNLIVLFRVPVLSVGATIVAQLIGGKLAVMVKSYLEDQHMAALSFNISIGSLERLGTGLIIFYYWDKIKAIRPANVMFINALVIFFIFYFFFSEVREVGKRLADLFVFGYWIIWPDLFECFKQRSLKIAFGVFLTIYCILKVIGTVGYPNTKYENILTGYTYYHQRLHQHQEDAKVVTKAQQGDGQ